MWCLCGVCVVESGMCGGEWYVWWRVVCVVSVWWRGYAVFHTNGLATSLKKNPVMT